MQAHKTEIRALIPHAGSMCLLDAVVSWDDDAILCTSQTHATAANPLRRDHQLSAVHAIEYAAQAIAVHGGLRARAARKTAPPGYLAAVREATLERQRLDNLSSTLQVSARRLFADNANSVYDCDVSADAISVAHARITIILRNGSERTQSNAKLQQSTLRSADPATTPTFEIERVIAPEHPSLPGHFPGQPIVPGVVILDEVVGALKQWRGVNTQVRAVPLLKFLLPLQPGQPFRIQLATDGSNDVDFRCLVGASLLAAGRLHVSDGK